jgi:hypothetical protein
MAYALEMAFTQINATIPQELLVAVFEPHKRGMSLDTCIYEDIIQTRVLKECNLYAGKMTSIPLIQEYIEKTEVSPYQAFPYESLYAIYRIPPEKREYKSITHVISVEFPSNYYNVAPFGVFGVGNVGCNRQNLSSLACDALSGAAGGINGMPRPLPELLAGDLVKLTPSASAPMPGFSWILNCRIELDKELTNLNSSSVKLFSQLVEYATKSYILIHSTLKIDKFYVEGGMEIGRVREIIDSYSDAEEKYQEVFKLFRSSAVTLDAPAKKRLIYWAL